MLPRRQTAPLALALVCAWLLLPSSSTSGEQEHGAPLEVIGFDGLLGALAHGHAAHGHGPAGRADRQEGGVLAAALRRGLANALRDAPRLRVMPHRRSLHPGQEMRLEVEETGHAVTVSRASLLLHRWRRPGGLPTGARDEAALRSAATYHRYDTATPQGLLDLNCTVRALLKTDTKWKPDGSTGNGDQAIKGEYNVISHSVAGSEADQQWVLAVVVRDMRNYKLAQWANSGSDQNFDGLEYDPERLGFSIVKYNHRTGNVPWESGTGGTGYADGKATEAVFSDRITSLAWYPSCSATDWRNKMCPPVRPGPARPSFYQPQGGEQWIFVADSGNCRVRLVDFQTGMVVTRWGSACLTGAAKSDLARYLDSPISGRNVLGSHLSLAWVSWKFLVVVDRDANRVRKFVTSQHQGLSPLAGRYNTTACHNHSHVDGDGTAATFCRPESVTASADGSRVVVAEALEHYGSHDMWRRLRVLDMHYTYLEGGDVGDVTCTVRTLRRVSLHLPGSSLLWSGLGGMVLSADGRVLIAGSVDDRILDYQWRQSVYDIGGDSVVAAVTLETGSMRILADAGGAPLHDVTTLSAVGAQADPPTTDPWYYPGASTVKLMIARHFPAAEESLPYPADSVKWTSPRTAIEILDFRADDLAQMCPPPALTTTSTPPPTTTPPPSNATNGTNGTNATHTPAPSPAGTAAADYSSSGGLLTCPQQCAGLRSQPEEQEAAEAEHAEAEHGGPQLERLLERAQVVVQDQHGVLRLVSTALLRDFARDAASTTPNPAFVSA